jgi:ribosomal protein S18 acetylase RimI-like enzyme
MAAHVTVADPAEIAELAAVAARTFPLACPPSSTPDNIIKFIDANLSPARFAEYLADPDRVVITAHQHRRIIGYCMLIRGVIDDPDVQLAVTIRPAVELSKMYVLPDSQGAGVADALMDAALVHAGQFAAHGVWLGVNQHNQRAQGFYRRHKFRVTGTRTFRVGEGIENDYVMVRRV